MSTVFDTTPQRTNFGVFIRTIGFRLDGLRTDPRRGPGGATDILRHEEPDGTGEVAMYERRGGRFK